MTPVAVRLAAGAARLWVACYTVRMPAAARDDRREEIAADLADQIGDDADGGAHPRPHAARVAMLPLGFLLLGIGLPRPVRRIPLALGVYLTAKEVVALMAVPLGMPLLYRSDSPVGVASGLLFDLALVAVGYSVWTQLPRRTPELSNA